MEKRNNRRKDKPPENTIFESLSDDFKKQFLSSEIGAEFEEPALISESDRKSQPNQKNRSNDKGRSNVSSNNEQVEYTHDVELPKDARAIFKNIDSINIKAVDNLYLLHQRFSGRFYYQYSKREEDRKSTNLESFLKFIYTDSIEYVEHKLREERKDRRTPQKAEQLFASYYKGSVVYKKGKKLCRTLCADLNSRVTTLSKYYQDTLSVTFSPSKLIVGIGGGTPYGSLLLMAFHPLYGIPYLPSTAIKGMLRSYWEQEVLIDEEDVEIIKVIEQLFGGEEKSGDLIFFDTFPQEFEIDFDVMSPHHRSYYGKDKHPTDDEDPVPIMFPYVKDATFKVYVACGRNEFMEKCFKTGSNCWKVILKELCKSEKELTLQDIVRATLADALKFYGIGAKTALGYGLDDLV